MYNKNYWIKSPKYLHLRHTIPKLNHLLKKIMPFKILFPILTTLLISSTLTSQNQSISDYGSKTSSQIITNSKGIKYNIKVTLPPNYDKNSTYKPVYYLDAWWLSEIVLGSNVLAYLSKKIEPLIFIGISAVGPENEWHLQRNLDYTPSKYSLSKMKITMEMGTVKLDSSNTGGSDQFLNFLEEQIIPTVEQKISVSKDERGFIGHSLGGLFGSIILKNKPHLFKNYMLISPSLWWNKNEIIDDKAMLNFLSINKLNIYISYGSYESKLIKNPIAIFEKLITEHGMTLENYTFKSYEGCNHISVLPRAIYDGLEMYYKLK